jgi:hypothetical protein
VLFVEALAMVVGKVGSASAARVKLRCSATARKTFSSSTSASFSNSRSVNGARFLELPDLLRKRRLRQMLDTKKRKPVGFAEGGKAARSALRDATCRDG